MRRNLQRFLSSHSLSSTSLIFVVGLAIGILATICVNRKTSVAPFSSDDAETDPTTEIIPEDFLLRRINNQSFAFVFSTGRSGTQHLSRVLRSNSYPKTYVTHEEEDDMLRTRDIVERDYRRLVATSSESAFVNSMQRYVRHTKLPFYQRLLETHRAHHLVFTGHVPGAFGLVPVLIDILPRGAVRVLRLRRERVSTVLSLMALGPQNEDPWGATQAGELDVPTRWRRWFPTPMDAHTRLDVRPEAWEKFNRFQRWLWYVDDIECRWQALRSSARGKFSFTEESLDNLHVLDGGIAWTRLARFMGVKADIVAASSRHNSIQTKNRTKEDILENILRQWDEDYRELVGPCRLTENLKISWSPVYNKR